MEFLRSHAPLQVVVEATACFDWFVNRAEGVADRVVVVAHPRKLRVIAESTRKTDKLDAQVLAEFLALGHDSRVAPSLGPATCPSHAGT